MKVLILTIVFFYIFPIFPSFLPIPLDRVIQGMAFIYLGFNIRNSKIIFTNRVFWGCFLLSLSLLLVSTLAQLRNLGNMEFSIIKDSLNLILYLISSSFIVFLIKDNWKNFTVTTVLDLIVTVGLLQAVLSLTFFFFPSLFEYYIGFINAEANMGLIKRVNLIELRLIGVGNAFFNGVIKYGVIFIILTYLKYDERSFFKDRTTLYFVSYSLLLCAGVMTGRTFFLAIALSLLYFFGQESKRLLAFTFKSLGYGAVLLFFLIIIISIFSNFIDGNRAEKVKDFVFEIFINYEETGQLRTNSSDKTADMYVLPDNRKTWLFGDGKFMDSGGSYYKGTDVGYLRYIYYFGIIGTSVFFFVQYKIVNWIASFNYSKAFSKLIYFLFFWILILNFKGIAYLDQFSALLLVSLIISNKNRA